MHYHRSLAPLLAPLLAATLAAGDAPLSTIATDRCASEDAEYRRLTKEIAAFAPDAPGRMRLEAETYRRDALIWGNDRTPVDVVLRRTKALIEHLASLPKVPDLAKVRSELAALTARNQPGLAEPQRKALFTEVCALRRRAAFANPLLTFDRMLFLTRHKQARGETHMIDQFLGFNAKEGGSVYVLDKPFSEAPVARDLFADSTIGNGRLKDHKFADGSFLSLELDYDAQTIACAWTEAKWQVPANADWSKQPWNEEECRLKPKNYHHYHWRDDNCFHIFTAKADGTQVKQLTDGMYNEYDPCFLPNGRLVYVSERAWSNQRCGTRWCGTTTLFGMARDGSDVARLSYHETSEWQPSVDNDGRIVYTRWDYTDRDDCGAHHLWVCNPDGTDPRAPHGNYSNKGIRGRPNMEVSYRAIPGGKRLIATAAPHHGQNFGSLVLVDPSLPDDMNMSQVKRLTPEVLFPESEVSPGVAADLDGTPNGKHANRLEAFGQPWPLSEDVWLVSYDPEGRHTGLYLADSFGNRIFIYRDAQVPINDPIPFAPRTKPRIIPSTTKEALVDRKPNADLGATVSVVDVYQSALPWPEHTRIAALRIVNVFPKDNAIMNVPRIGPHQSIARGSLGTVPVEADGSAHFIVPPGVEFYLQTLDEKGRAIQSMRTGTYVHQGEHMSCIGCHESRTSAATSTRSKGGTPIAMRRAASRPTPEPVGSWPMSFPRLVQPVLDAKCVECHQKNPKSPDLSGNLFEVSKPRSGDYPRWLAIAGVSHEREGWSKSYVSLSPYAWRWEGGGAGRKVNFELQYSVPGTIGARQSKLVALLEKDHHGVTLNDEEWRRLTLWMDLNSNFYGAYHEPDKQSKGELVIPRWGIPEDVKNWVR